jgi:nitrite reductase/ring-hydroxylating ferredoxin subunit
MAFVTVGKAEEAPAEGELARFEVSGTAVAVANVGGRLYALGDTCTHAECSLAEGDLEGTQVVCVCHGGTFEVTTGEVVAPPPTTGEPVYDVRVEGDQLQIEV